MCFLLPGWGWQETEEERGIGTGPVEADGVEPVLRATGGSEEPLSISDTGDRTGICCREMERLAFTLPTVSPSSQTKPAELITQLLEVL